MKIKVPINWNDSNSEKIGIYVKRYGNPTPKKIIVVLTSGVGVANTHLIKDLYNRNKDLLFLIPDHRGTGYSENLWCEKDKRILNLQNIDDKKFESCFQELKKIWKDNLQYFNSWQAGMDVNALLDKYPNIPVVIYATSYGTVWAKRVLNKQNKNIEKVYLESPIITRQEYNLEKNIEEPIKIFYDNCKKSSYCNKILNLNSFNELKLLFKNVKDKKYCSNIFDDEMREDISEKSIWLLQYNYTSPLFVFLISAVKNCDIQQVKNIFKYKDEIHIAEIGNYHYSSYLYYNIFCNEILDRKNKNKRFIENPFGFIDSSSQKCSYVPKYDVVENNYSVMKNANYKTLILYGEADTSTNTEYALRLKSKFSEKNTKLIKIKELAHLPLDFKINYDDFYESKFHEAETCRLNILSEYFANNKDWPDLNCTENIYPPIYSSDNALKLYEKIFNNS